MATPAPRSSMRSTRTARRPTSLATARTWRRTTGGMAMLRRWLDPPDVIARKRLLRAARGSGHSGEDRQFEIGCLVPIGFVVAVLVGTGVLIGMGLQRGAPASPD